MTFYGIFASFPGSYRVILWGDEIFGRHALLSRGWGLRDKRCIMPMTLQRHRLGLTTSRFEGCSSTNLCDS